VLAGWEGELVVSAFTAVEADYLILTRLGVDAELRFLEDLSGAYLVDSLDAKGLDAATKLCRRRRDLEIGLADASIVVLCRKWNTRIVATFDDRHFRSLRPLQGGSFELLPADGG
jgi:predicted nucleic acid-binding protein